jgi:hypothetical protein
MRHTFVMQPPSPSTALAPTRSVLGKFLQQEGIQKQPHNRNYSDLDGDAHVKGTPPIVQVQGAAILSNILLPTCPPAHLPTSPPVHLLTCPPAHLPTSPLALGLPPHVQQVG